ncbi:hypothetical protein CCP2SC5_740012 [Azospirillaceae bacterium]
MKPPIKILLNSSALKRLGCDREYQFTCVDGYVTADRMGYLRMGKAIHKYAEMVGRGLPVEKAGEAAMNHLDPMVDDIAQLLAAIKTFRPTEWFGTIPPGLEKYIERKFNFYWRTIVIEDQPYDIWLLGTMDRLGMRAGILEICDFKSSRSWDRKKIFDEYSRSTQMMFYYWVPRKFPYECFRDSIDCGNLAYHGNLAIRVCPVFISGKSPSWQMSEALSYGHMMEEFTALMVAASERVAWIHHEAGTRIALATGMQADHCPKCDFGRVCHAPAGVEPEKVLEAQYTKRVYDPTTW